MKKLMMLVAFFASVGILYQGTVLAADLDQAAAVRDQKVDESKRTDDPVSGVGNATYDAGQGIVKGTGNVFGAVYKAGKSVVTGKNQFKAERDRVAAHPDMEKDDAARTDDPVAAVGNATQTGGRNIVKGTKWTLGTLYKALKSAATGHNEFRKERERERK